MTKRINRYETLATLSLISSMLMMLYVTFSSFTVRTTWLERTVTFNGINIPAVLLTIVLYLISVHFEHLSNELKRQQRVLARKRKNERRAS